VDDYISSESVITGDVHTKSSLKIDGQVKGNIQALGDVHIGTASRIEGSISGKDVQVAGSVCGNISAQGEIILYASASLTGDIKAVAVTIEKGAVYSGKTCVAAEPPKPEAKAEVRPPEPVIVKKAL